MTMPEEERVEGREGGREEAEESQLSRRNRDAFCVLSDSIPDHRISTDVRGGQR
jgi:hypothetical protein